MPSLIPDKNWRYCGLTLLAGRNRKRGLAWWLKTGQRRSLSWPWHPCALPLLPACHTPPASFQARQLIWLRVPCGPELGNCIKRANAAEVHSTRREVNFDPLHLRTCLRDFPLRGAKCGSTSVKAIISASLATFSARLYARALSDPGCKGRSAINPRAK
jgi:hypothetical protein